MINEFYDVVLVDFSGVLPFKLEKEDILTRKEIVATENLRNFLLELELISGNKFIYLGSDILETKLFHRLLLEDGLLELLIGTPITLLGHFKEKNSAEKFKNSLQNVLSKMLPEILKPLIEDSIELRKVTKDIIKKDELKFKKLGEKNG